MVTKHEEGVGGDHTRGLARAVDAAGPERLVTQNMWRVVKDHDVTNVRITHRCSHYSIASVDHWRHRLARNMEHFVLGDQVTRSEMGIFGGTTAESCHRYHERNEGHVMNLPVAGQAAPTPWSH